MRNSQTVHYLHQTLLAAKALGLKSMSEISRQAADQVPMPQEELETYFGRLDYDLDESQQEGLRHFFDIYVIGEFAELPQLRFI